VHKFNHILLLDRNSTYHQIRPTLAATPTAAIDLTLSGRAAEGRKASLTTSYSLYEEEPANLTVQEKATSGASGIQKPAKLVPSHWHFSTLPRKKLLLVATNGSTTAGSANDTTAVSADSQSVTSTSTEIILPPPPQFKGVHFDPDVMLSAGGFGLVLEGLPEFPAALRADRERIDI
jgi:hypothetical protein